MNKVKIVLFVMILLLSCNDKNDTNFKNEKNLPLKDSLSFVFKDAFNSDTLMNYRFGVSSDKSELPLDYIFVKSDYITINKEKSNLFINKIKNFNKSKDSLYGYFCKNGYRLKKFLITNSLNNKHIEIIPASSLLTFKAIDLDASKRIDSLHIDFNIVNKESSKQIFYLKGIKGKKSLEYFNYRINPNEIININILVFTKNKSYRIKRIVNYIPISDIIIYIF